MDNTKQRNVTFDIIRAVSILWIIGVWHMQEYFQPIPALKVFGWITYSALGAFTFMSGFFLGKKECSPSNFYVSRFKRFYPLYLLSIILLTIGHFIGSWKQSLFAITGLSCFIMPQVKTMWYISMMIIFYLVTPILLSNINTKQNKALVVILRSLIVIIIFWGISLITDIDYRIIRYFCFYVIGMVTTKEQVELIFRRKNLILILFLFFLGLLLFTPQYKLLKGILGFVLLFCLCDYLSSYSFCVKILSKVSYASMCAYLFHRQIFHIFKVLFKNTDGYINFIYMPVMLIAVFILAYIIQHYYDKLVASFERK